MPRINPPLPASTLKPSKYNVDYFALHDTTTAAVYTLSLHDALPISFFAEITEAFAWPTLSAPGVEADDVIATLVQRAREDRKSTRLNSSHVKISYAVFCLKKKKTLPALNVKLSKYNGDDVALGVCKT